MKNSKLSKNLKDAVKWRGIKTIEYRILWRALCIIFFATLMMSYFIATVPGTYKWIELSWYRAQDLGQLDEILKQADTTGDTSYADRWIRARSSKDSKEILDKIGPYTPKFPGTFFLNLSVRGQTLPKEEDRLFWSMLAKYRIYYDAARCGQPMAIHLVTEMINVWWKDSIYFSASKAEEAKAMRAVMEFDSKYPAQNKPDKICLLVDGLYRIKDKTAERVEYQIHEQEEWEAIRIELRRITEDSLIEVEKELR